MIRRIIHIDEEKCNGCGACAAACHESAIGMVDGKAKLLRDDYCDGLGDCLPACPTGAITFVEREAAAYDEEAVLANQRKKAGENKSAHHMSGGCPGSRMRQCPTGFIIICQDLNLGASIPRYQKDVGIVAQTMLLAAAERGLGGCMIGNYNADSVKKELHLAENLAPVLIVAFGKPAEKIVIKEIEEGENIAYYRDENDVHYVPKRKLEDIIIKK